MYVRKSEYARTVARNKELEEQNNAQYLVIKKLLKENQKLKEEVKDLVERNIEYEKKYNIVLGKINKLEEENEKLRKWIKEHVDYQTQADFRNRFEHK